MKLQPRDNVGQESGLGFSVCGGGSAMTSHLCGVVRRTLGGGEWKSGDVIGIFSPSDANVQVKYW